MHHADEKIIPIGNSDDEHQITAVLAASVASEYLFKGKRQCCYPPVTFQKKGHQAPGKSLI